MRRQTFFRGFWSGATLATGIHILWQDYLGLEGYIQHLRGHWSPWWVGVPLALIGGAFAIFQVYKHARR